MATFAIKYNPKNIAVTKILDAVMHLKGVEKIYPEDELSPEEMAQVEKSLNSGFSTMDELREILRR
jgi:hypothetical protein